MINIKTSRTHREASKQENLGCGREMKMSISTETIENEPQIIRHPALSWWHTFMHALLIERAVSWYNLQIWAAHWLQLGTHVRCQQQQQHHNHAHTAHHNYYVVSPDMTAHYTLPLHTSLGSRDTWLVLSPHTDTSPRSSYNNGQETQLIILDRRMKVQACISPIFWDWMTPPLWFGFLWSEHQRLFVRDCGYSRVIIFILHRHTRASSHGRTKPQPSRRVVLNCQNFFWLN